MSILKTAKNLLRKILPQPGFEPEMSKF